MADRPPQPLRGATSEEKVALFRANAEAMEAQARAAALPQQRARFEAAAAHWRALAELQEAVGPPPPRA